MAAILMIVAILLLWFLCRTFRGHGEVLCAGAGIIALIGGGIGYFVADRRLKDGDFWSRYYGRSEYTTMVDLRNIGRYAIVIGVLLVVVGVILYATRNNRRSTASGSVGKANMKRGAPLPRKEAARFCADCGRPLTASGSFCPFCGSRNTETVRRCAGCGAELKSDAVFCPACGTKNGE